MSDNTETTVKTREQLKQTFVDGAIPRGSDFADVFDAFVHKNDEPATPTPTPSSGISSFEQFLIAFNPLYHSSGNGYYYEYNIRRLPMQVMTGVQMTYDSMNHFVPRAILFHRDKFYDNNQPGALSHVFATFSSSLVADTAFTIDIDQAYLYFTLFSTTPTAENPSTLNWNITADRTITWNGFTITITLDTTNNTIAVEILGSYANPGTHSFTIYDTGGTTATLYGDAAHTTPPEYGGSDANGYYISNPSSSGTARLYIKLTETLNPGTANLNYYQYDCYYCDESELDPGTYYTINTSGMGPTQYWLDEVVVPETSEE